MCLLQQRVWAWGTARPGFRGKIHHDEEGEGGTPQAPAGTPHAPQKGTRRPAGRRRACSIERSNAAESQGESGMKRVPPMARLGGTSAGPPWWSGRSESHHHACKQALKTARPGETRPCSNAALCAGVLRGGPPACPANPSPSVQAPPRGAHQGRFRSIPPCFSKEGAVPTAGRMFRKARAEEAPHHRHKHHVSTTRPDARARAKSGGQACAAPPDPLTPLTERASEPPAQHPLRHRRG